ncbi:hypothetical protein [Streptomyces cyanogenus]|uniref:Uncharacterized protein n=1 Tax=Streptomyces cyanogenus TaxID=80860 RepID=A0ABX7U2I0_STRCY|nr:hypothetical protein [Streptomyces cyanogenus]QTD95740.1 hypothetical protein S1361_00205 [Streptomyces cyanogenus]QTE03250.1 hypothetical protein S1361_38295 [Streptomyces cyanogenus]
MPQLVREQHVDVFVGYHAFALQESDDAFLDLEFPDEFNFGTFLSTHPGRLDITSAGHTHTASLTVEVWDGPAPVQDSAAWEEQAEADFESVSGQVAVWSMSLGRLDDLITLADSGGLWRVRVSSAGRADVKALAESEESIKGVERYLVQFWPADS